MSERARGERQRRKSTSKNLGRITLVINIIKLLFFVSYVILIF